MTNADVSKQWKSQEKIKNQSKNATNKLISEEAYKSDIWVTTSIGFEYSYSLIHTILFVTQKSWKSPSLYRSLTWP